MKIQYIFIAILVSIACFAAGFQLGPMYSVTPNPYLSAMADSDPAVYRSRQASVGVELDGDAAKVREAMLHPDPLERASRLGSLLLTLGPDSLDEIKEAFDTIFLDLGDLELVLFADWWARFDPHAAMEWSESDWRNNHRVIGMQILRSWGRIDPRAALVRAQKGRGPKAGDKKSYQLAAIAGWEQTDQLGVLGYLQAIGPGMQRQKMMRGFARRRVFRYGIEDALEFIESLPDADTLFKLNLMRRAVSAAVRIDPQRTADLSAGLQSGPLFQGLPQRIAIPWTRIDPLATTRWLGTLEDSRARNDGVREAYRIWASFDNSAATDWVTGTKHEAWRDHALAVHARQIQLADHDKGVALAEKILDDELRQATLTLIVRVWAKYDEAAAAKYVDKSDWTQNQRDRALAVGWRERVITTIKLEEKEGIAAKQVKDQMVRDLVESDLEEPSESE